MSTCAFSDCTSSPNNKFLLLASIGNFPSILPPPSNLVLKSLGPLETTSEVGCSKFVLLRTLHLYHAKFVGTAQVPKLVVKVVEHDANPIDRHFCFGKCYQDHELFHHVNETTPFQPYALD